jgi:hypothetical protein
MGGRWEHRAEFVEKPQASCSSALPSSTMAQRGSEKGLFCLFLACETHGRPTISSRAFVVRSRPSEGQGRRLTNPNA